MWCGKLRCATVPASATGVSTSLQTAASSRHLPSCLHPHTRPCPPTPARTTTHGSSAPFHHSLHHLPFHHSLHHLPRAPSFLWAGSISVVEVYRAVRKAHGSCIMTSHAVCEADVSFCARGARLMPPVSCPVSCVPKFGVCKEGVLCVGSERDTACLCERLPCLSTGQSRDTACLSTGPSCAWLMACRLRRMHHTMHHTMLPYASATAHP